MKKKIKQREEINKRIKGEIQSHKEKQVRLKANEEEQQGRMMKNANNPFLK